MQGEIGSAVSADEQKLSIGAYIPLTRVLRPLMTICSMSEVTRERAESMKGKYADTALTVDRSIDGADGSSDGSVFLKSPEGCRRAAAQHFNDGLVRHPQYYLLSSAILSAALAIVRSLSSSSAVPTPDARESVLFREVPARSPLLPVLLLATLEVEVDGVGPSGERSISASCICRRLVRTTKREVRRRISEAC